MESIKIVPKDGVIVSTAIMWDGTPLMLAWLIEGCYLDAETVCEIHHTHLYMYDPDGSAFVVRNGMYLLINSKGSLDSIISEGSLDKHYYSIHAAHGVT